MNSFSERVVIITGGGARMGGAAALPFAEQGARVSVTGRRVGPLKALANAHRNIMFEIVDTHC
jgi:3-hydroxybutyrate dehydrogenase